MNKEINKKILILGLILLIIAGIVVVLLKGFNVDLMLESHEEITYKLDTEYELKDIESICKEVFGSKKVIIKEVEFFKDAVAINVSSALSISCPPAPGRTFGSRMTTPGSVFCSGTISPSPI